MLISVGFMCLQEGQVNHYFTNIENVKSNIRVITINIYEKAYYFYSDKGVFSKNELDFGTRLLLETLPVSQMKGSILDVGCGYGPIGLILKDKTNCDVDMIDINLRALHLTKLNAKKNKVEVNIYESNAYKSVNKKYDYIITNPPIRAGKKKVYEILIGAHNFLSDNGQLWFIMRKDQGLKSALKDIADYYNLSIINKKNGFYVVCAIKRSKNIDNA